MMAKIICIEVILLLVTSTHCARILTVLPSAFYSHQLQLSLLYKELSLRGHQVIAITTSPFNDKRLINLTEINVGYINRHVQNITFAKQMAERNTFLNIYGFFNGLGDVAEEIISDSRVQKLLNDDNEHFDLVIVEWCAHPAFAALSQRFKSPLIGFRSMELRPMCHEPIGNPTNPSYIPVGSTDFRPGFFGRLDNFLIYILHAMLHRFVMLPRARSILEKYVKGCLTDVEAVERNVSIIIANTHPILNGVRPIAPNYIQIPGLHLHETGEGNKLPVHLTKFLDSAKEGVIYISFGTVIRRADLEGNQLHVLVSALEKLRYKVLWKLNGGKSTDFPHNIKIVKWVHQKSVLAHKNVKLFITHGGILSYQEAVHYKVPLVGMPFNVDQYVNVNRMVELRIGKRLNFYSMDEEEAISVIKEVMENTTYKKGISRISDMIKNQERMEPMEKVIWWIEYVLRHNGTSIMRSSSLDLNFFQYLLLDVVAFLIIVIIFTAVLVFKLIALAKLGLNYIIYRKKKSKKE